MDDLRMILLEKVMRTGGWSVFAMKPIFVSGGVP
jgi:hypothetical protein